MNQKITALLRQRSRLLGLFVGGLGIVMLVLSGVGYLNDRHTPSRKLSSQPAVAGNETSSEPKQDLPATPIETQPADASSSNQPSQNRTQNQPTHTVPATSGNAGANQSTAAPKANIQVTLKVNDNSKGSVTLPEGSNQCDVLQYALDTELISSLTMKYNSSLKSYGVYVIDGIGESDTVWWGYTVNGKSPPLGCSRIEAKNGDSVHWEYVK